MGKNRLEAFSDAVIAIIMTIMVLELRPPELANWNALSPLVPVFLAYVMSFVYLAIYWNNHHHMLHATDHVDGRILWANMLLLFWLSLIPFVTSWLSESGFAQLPIILYGVVLLLSGISYDLLTRAIIGHHDTNHVLREAVGRNWKGSVSLALYALAIIVGFTEKWAAMALYIFVALMWFVPDRRIERKIGHRH